MKNTGKSSRAAWKVIFWTLVLLLAVFAVGILATALGTVIAVFSGVLIGLWVLFALFTLYFFRDPNPMAPVIPNAIVAPAHGKVDVIDELHEPAFMGGKCQRISIFLSVFDVHIQKAPVTGRVVLVKHTPGKFLSATKSDTSDYNEHVLIGIEPAMYADKKIGVKQIAGLIARRIITWVEVGEKTLRSERIGLIQFGSRVDLLLPLGVKIHAKLGDKVKGGETILASFE